jgi:RPA family protein
LAFKCNKNLTITVDGGTLGDATVTNKDYVYPITISAESTELTIEFKNTLSSNARIDDIKLYQGVGKQPAGIAWSKSTASVTYGNPDDTYKYLPTFSNPNNLDVTFESSNSDVISISTDGELEVEGPGETTLTASFAGNDEYEEATVTCKVTVNKPQADIKNTPETAYTVAEVLDILSEVDNNKKTDSVYVRGSIKEITEVSLSNGNATFVITDGTNDFLVFRTKYLEKENFTAEDQIKVEDEVVVYGQLVNYLSSSAAEGTAPTPEVAQGGYIYSLNGETQSQAENPEDAIEGGTSADDALTVDQALAYINAFPEAGFTTKNQYYVKGTVSSDPEINTDKGNATFQMNGTTGILTIFRVKGLENNNITKDDYLKKDDEVIILAKLQKYVTTDATTPEMSSGYIYSLNGKTTETDTPADFEGDGTQENPYTVGDLKQMKASDYPTEAVWVKGVIIGSAASATTLNPDDNQAASNIAIAAITRADAVEFIPVELKNNTVFRTSLNVKDHSENIGKEILLNGTITSYFSTTGVKGLVDAIIDGESVTGIQNLTIDVDDNAPMYNLKGERVDANYRGVVIKAGKKTIQK